MTNKITFLNLRAAYLELKSDLEKLVQNKVHKRVKF